MHIPNYQRNETFQKNYFKECMKNEHPNVFICPDKGMFKIQTPSIHQNVRILRNIAATSENKSIFRGVQCNAMYSVNTKQFFFVYFD